MDYRKDMWVYYEPKAYHNEKLWSRIDSPDAARDSFISRMTFTWSDVGKLEVHYKNTSWYKHPTQFEMTSVEQRDLFRCLFETKRVEIHEEG